LLLNSLVESTNYDRNQTIFFEHKLNAEDLLLILIRQNGKILPSSIPVLPVNEYLDLLPYIIAQLCRQDDIIPRKKEAP